ncbi:MAG TPA: hypothetical protein VFR58_17465 [Flavisolibacter sp.]|nr:hypothetical protein [Flavisolibacter sp.]
MNYNICAYLIYLVLMVFIILYAGRYFFINGRIFMVSLFKGNTELADQINKLLLVAYYLFNIGYAFIKLRYWQKISHAEMLFWSLSTNMGMLILILGVTHYFNMLLIYLLSRSKSISLTNKSFQL